MFNQLFRYGRQVNSHDLVKAIAMLSMFGDHIGLYLMNDNSWLRIIGRMAAPLFFFIFGTVHRHYFRVNILIYGLVLTLLTFFLEDSFYFNILINFILITLILNKYQPDKLSNLALTLTFVLLFICLWFSYQWLEYGSLGLMFAFAGRLIAEKDQRAFYWLSATILSYFLMETVIFQFTYVFAYELLFILICLALWASLFFFQFRFWQLSKWLSYPLLFLSRYSLQIYFIHLALLKIYYVGRFI